MPQLVVSLLPSCIVLLGSSQLITCYKKLWLVILKSFWEPLEWSHAGPLQTVHSCKFHVCRHNIDPISSSNGLADIVWQVYLNLPPGLWWCNHLSLFLCVANHDKLLPGLWQINDYIIIQTYPFLVTQKVNFFLILFRICL